MDVLYDHKYHNICFLIAKYKTMYCIRVKSPFSRQTAPSHMAQSGTSTRAGSWRNTGLGATTWRESWSSRLRSSMFYRLRRQPDVGKFCRSIATHSSKHRRKNNGGVKTKRTEILKHEGSVIIIIIIRTGSQMENKLHENISKKVGRPKEHTG